jgi:hypothetical protein
MSMVASLLAVSKRQEWRAALEALKADADAPWPGMD